MRADSRTATRDPLFRGTPGPFAGVPQNDALFGSALLTFLNILFGTDMIAPQ